MAEISKPAQFIVWGGLAALIAVIAAAYVRTELLRPPAPIEFIAPEGPRLDSPDSSGLPVLSAISNFTLTNQFGEVVSRTDLDGSPWVADVIFTRCPSICPQMSFQMSRIQQALGSKSPTRLISITTDPQFDTPDILKNYGSRFAAVPGTWHFLTGPQAAINALIHQDLKLIAMEKEEAERESANDLYNHSVLFAIVDKQGKLRRVVHANDTNFNVIDEIIATVSALNAAD